MFRSNHPSITRLYQGQMLIGITPSISIGIYSVDAEKYVIASANISGIAQEVVVRTVVPGWRIQTYAGEV